MNSFYQNRLAYLIILVAIFIRSISGNSYAQERGLIQSKYYSTKDYKASTQNWAIAQDNRGVLYFGNLSGLLEFDGVNWRLIEVPNKSTVRGLAFDQNNILYLGAFGELGYMIPDQLGDFKYHSLTHLIPNEFSNFGEIWDVISFSDTVFFLSDHYLFRYVKGKIDCWESENERFYLSHKVGNTYYLQEMGNGLLKFENDSLHLIKKGAFFSDKRLHTILPVDDMLVLFSRTDGLFSYRVKNNLVEIKSFSELSAQAKRLNKYFLYHSFYHGVELSNNQYALSSITGDIRIVDSKWNVLDVINEQTIGIKSPAHVIHFQKNHSLWLALANGICQVEVISPYRYWNEELGISGVITDVSRLNEYMYVSTGIGIFYTKAIDCDDFSLNQFYPVEGKFEQAWSFTYFKRPNHEKGKKQETRSCDPIPITRNTLLLASTSNGLFRIDKDKSYKISNYGAVFKSYQSRSNQAKVRLGLNTGVGILEYQNGNWIDLGFKYGIEANIRDVGEDLGGNLWLSATYKGIYRIKNPYSKVIDSIKVELFDTSHGLPSIRSNSFVETETDFYFFCEDDEYYRFNPTLKKFEFYTEAADSTKEDAHQYVDSLSWRRHSGNYISNFYVTTQEDSVVWFSTNEGVFKHSGGTNRNYFDLPPVLIRRVTSGDSILFAGTNFIENGKNFDDSQRFEVCLNAKVDLGTVLDYRSNSLTFSYAWPFYESEKPNQFSYYLDGYDNGWSDWTSESKKEYTNLPEGNYIFNVKSKNLYRIVSEPAEFHFKILPPWYRTYFAYMGYALVSILAIALIVKFYTYRLIKEKEKLEGIVKERTQEILMQNEEILVQAEHLKDANEWISAKNVELEAQKKEIEKKKDQLEVSNATKNKFFRIIAHDLRNPISTLVGSTGYILTDYDDFDKEKTKHFIVDLNKLSLTTYNLLENLLDWSTSQMGEIKFEPTNLDLIGVVNENIDLVNSKINEKHIELDVTLPENLTVYADENMVNTVVRNLLTNAVKFTQDHGHIKIFAKVDEKTCSLSISDDGVGISKENLEKLFRIEKHVTTPGTHNEKGSGLGLILCKEFIERNGGTISVESEPNKGSTFIITLKLT